MSTIHIDSYSLLQRIYPLSLLAQLTSRKATGRLRVCKNTESWYIYLEAGKLIYASYSEELFERLEYYLDQLNPHIPHFRSSEWLKAGFVFNSTKINTHVRVILVLLFMVKNGYMPWNYGLIWLWA